TDQKILGHPYLKELEQGRIQREQLKIFAGQQHHIISSDLRSIALILSRHGTLPSRKFLMNALQGEASALEALHAFTSALRLTGGDLESIEPLPAAHAYCSFVAWLALYCSDAELTGAFLVNLSAWGANCGRMRKALQEKYGMSQSALAFFDLFANMPSFEAEALDIIQSALERGVPARLIHRAARMLQSYELMFWDAMADAAGIPLSSPSRESSRA
ncbi:MAG: thiaminase II/PqqC family protein, partial [Burkholderiales bacterium]